jgi:hypothetical protein
MISMENANCPFSDCFPWCSDGRSDKENKQVDTSMSSSISHSSDREEGDRYHSSSVLSMSSSISHSSDREEGDRYHSSSV